MQFLIRWLVSTLGLWIAVALLGSERVSVGNRPSTVIVAGFILALTNMVLKPIIIFFSLPAIIITLGLFMFVVNGLVVLLASHLYGPFYVKNLWVAMVVGLIVGLVNYLVTKIIEEKN